MYLLHFSLLFPSHHVMIMNNFFPKIRNAEYNESDFTSVKLSSVDEKYYTMEIRIVEHYFWNFVPSAQWSIVVLISTASIQTWRQINPDPFLQWDAILSECNRLFSTVVACFSAGCQISISSFNPINSINSIALLCVSDMPNEWRWVYRWIIMDWWFLYCLLRTVAVPHNATGDFVYLWFNLNSFWSRFKLDWNNKI